MSNTDERFKASKRRHSEESAINRQVKIAKTLSGFVKSPHHYAKRHAMDCGRPKCMLCGNPRHLHKDSLTVQEKRANCIDIDKELE